MGRDVCLARHHVIIIDSRPYSSYYGSMMVGKLRAVNQIARLDLTRRLKEPQNYSEFQCYRPPALAADRLAAVPRLERWNTLDGRWDWLHRKLTEKYRLTTPLERLFVSPRIRIEIPCVFQALVRTQTHARVPRKAHPLYPYLTI